MRPSANTAKIRNPLLEREPELWARLAAFRSNVNDMLLDAMAGRFLSNHGNFGASTPIPLEEVRAVALVLRSLCKEQWSERDLELMEMFWREAICSALFGEEFEADRFRIEHGIETARKQRLSQDRHHR